MGNSLGFHPMPFESSLLALPVTDLALLGMAAVLCTVAGWQVRRMATRGGEEALKRSLFEAKGAVPQLESAARLQTQRAETLALEIRNLKERLAEYDAAARQKDNEIIKRDREIHRRDSELRALKDGTGNAGEVMLDGDSVEMEPASADPDTDKRYAALQARYDALAQSLFQRDDRIAELEEQLKNPDSQVPTRTLEQQIIELEQNATQLQATLEEREKQLEDLQSRLQDEAGQREAFEDLARRRSEGNRALKSAATAFEQKIPALEEQIKAREAELAERQDKLVSINRMFREERTLRETREGEVADLQGQVVSLQAQLSDLQQSLQRGEAALRTLQAEQRQTREALQATEATVREREATIVRAEEQIAAANEAVAAGERAAAALQNAIKDRDFKITELESDAGRQSAKLEMLRGTLQEAKASHEQQLTELVVRHDAQRDAMQTKISEQLGAIADREVELTELSSANAELAPLKDQVAALGQQVEQLSHALAATDTALRQKQWTILSLATRMGTPQLLLPAPSTVNGAQVVDSTPEPTEAVAQAH